MSSATITREGDVLAIQGDLVFTTILKVLAESKPLLAALPVWTIDLGGVRHADSAGLALLTAWFRQARLQQTSLCFYNIPVQMQKIINVSGLSDILPIQAAASTCVRKL